MANLLQSRLENSDNNKSDKKKKKDKFIKPRRKKGILAKKMDKNTNPDKKDYNKKNKVNAINTEAFDEELDKEYETISLKKEKKEKSEIVLNKLQKVGILAICMYLIFLIYGILITDYVYDENGNSVPLEMSYSDLKKLDEFELLIEKYEEMRELYKMVLELDSEVMKNSDNAMIYSTEYEGLLENVGKLSTQTDAIAVATEYQQIKSMILVWIKTDIAVYLQNMSAAISESNTQKLSNASQDRERMKNDFEVISQNLIAIGNKVKGFDSTGIINWDVNEYISSLAE